MPDHVQLQAMMDAGRRIHSLIDAIDLLLAARLGVHPNDLRCLRLLDAQCSATPREIALSTGLTSGSVTALVDRLEQAELVSRCRSCDDRRSVAIVMTDGGRCRFRALIAELEAVVRDSFGRLGPAEMVEATDALTLLGDALVRVTHRLAGDGASR